MARRKKRKQKRDLPSLRPQLDPELVAEITAIVLVALAFLLILAMFGVGGSLLSWTLTGLRILVGWVAYVLPLLFFLLAWLLFQPKKYQMRANNYIGLFLIVVALAGLMHLPYSDNALQHAKDGVGGGVIGYLVSLGLLRLANKTASIILLIAVLLISFIVATNTKLSDVWHLIMKLFRRGNEDEFAINDPASAVLSTKLPIRGTLGGKPPAQQEFEPLTAGADPDWKGPGLDLLEETTTQPDAGNIKENAATIHKTLESFGIEVGLGEVNVGPTVTQYTIKPESGVKLNKITQLDHNLSLALAAHPLRIEAPIPGKSAVGIEIPNKKPALVRMRDLVGSNQFKASKSPLTFVLGRDVSGEPMIADLAKMPHMLIAGATGSGKSIMINTFLMSLLYRNSPSDLKLILVDPKRVELTMYNNIPHLLSPVIVEPKECISALKWTVMEMERRYKLFAEVGKRNIGEYNSAKKDEGMPYIVVVIDELADLMHVASQEVESAIVRLAQMSRATGIHLVLATQRPSVNVITGLIKANVPARLAFTVAQQVDSRVIIDQGGAEKLLGSGDMLYMSSETPKPKRIQSTFISEKEIKAVTEYLKKEREPSYNEEVLTQPVHMGAGGRGHDFDGSSGDDDLFQEAADTVIRSGKASASLLQRRLRVGYARAARLLDILEERGVIGPPDGARPRDVLVSSVDEAASVEDITIEE